MTRKITKSEYEFAGLALDTLPLTSVQKVAVNRILDLMEHPAEAQPLTADQWLAWDELRLHAR